MDFFINEENKQIKVKGQLFKYKPVNAGDELEWANDYLERKIIIKNNKEFEIMEQNFAKLSLCKLRNITEVPFKKEDLQKITNLKKEYKDYTNSEKDLLFKKLNPQIYNNLVKEIDKINSNQKKD